MAHPHQHASDDYGRAFAIGVLLNLVYVVVEASCGLYADSLALLSDAGHNLSDVFALMLAWGGHALARIPPTNRRTYGWRGSTILAALFNALILLAAVGGIAWEAIRRFWEPAAPGGMFIVVVAAMGVLVNTATALLFISGRKQDLNIQGAFLHMAADAGVSVAVVLAGLGIYFTGWSWIDPVTSLFIAAVIFVSTWELLKESVNLAMQAVPAGINPEAVEDYFASLEGICEVHDLHIWAMSTTENALTVHLVKPDLEDEDELLNRMRQELHDRFDIEHVTIQIERGSGPSCAQSGLGCI